MTAWRTGHVSPLASSWSFPSPPSPPSICRCRFSLCFMRRISESEEGGGEIGGGRGRDRRREGERSEEGGGHILAFSRLIKREKARMSARMSTLCFRSLICHVSPPPPVCDWVLQLLSPSLSVPLSPLPPPHSSPPPLCCVISLGYFHSFLGYSPPFLSLVFFSILLVGVYSKTRRRETLNIACMNV